MLDLVLRLRELRRLRGLSQKDVSCRTGIGEKSISSFETGNRIDTMKISQLRKLLQAYEVTEAEFFDGSVDRMIAPWESSLETYASQIFDDMHALPAGTRRALLDRFRTMLNETLRLQHVGTSRPPMRQVESDWQLLTSRN